MCEDVGLEGDRFAAIFLAVKYYPGEVYANKN